MEETVKFSQNLLAPGGKVPGGEAADRPRLTRSLSQRGQLASRSFSEPKNRFPSGRAQSIISNEMSVESSARYSFLWQKLWPGSGLPPSCRPFIDRRESQPGSLCRKASLNGRNEDANTKRGWRESVPPMNTKEKSSKTKSKVVVGSKEWEGQTAVEDNEEDEDSDLDEESMVRKKTRRRRNRRKLWRVGFQKKNKDDGVTNKISQEPKVSGTSRKDIQSLLSGKTGKQKTDPPKTPKAGVSSCDPSKKLNRSSSLAPVVHNQPWKARVKFKGGSLAVTAVNCGFSGDGAVADESEVGEDEEPEMVERTEGDEVSGEHKRKKRKKKKKRKVTALKSGKKVPPETETGK